MVEKGWFDSNSSPNVVSLGELTGDNERHDETGYNLINLGLLINN